MPQPSLDEFKKVLLTQPLEGVVQDTLFRGDAYVFRDWPDGLQTLQSHLSTVLKVSSENLAVIGSAKTGFSLSPDSFGRLFSDASDIDVLVVDDRLFDSTWKSLLKWNYPRRHRLSGMDKKWADARSEDVYWGWLSPQRILFSGLSFPSELDPLKEFCKKWADAFRGFGRVGGFESRNVNGRLYRTWDHALLYHVDGLRKVREALQGGERKETAS